MNIYYKDIESFDGKWRGLLLNLIDYDAKPSCHIQSGRNHRIRLVNHDTALLWATVEEEHYGIWVLKSDYQPDTNSMLISPILSKDIEVRKELENEEWLKSWGRLFINKLMQSQAFLHKGIWQITPLKYRHSHDQNRWNFESSRFADDYINNVSSFLYFDKSRIFASNPEWIDWDSSDSGNLIALKTPDHYDSRLKWWRKKIKEAALPPILIWYIRGLCAYVIVDGHYRLLAAIEANHQPDFIVIESVQEIRAHNDTIAQDRALNSVYKQAAHNSAFPVKKINDILVRFFDDRPFYLSSTQAVGTYNMEAIWTEEVSTFLNSIGKKEYVQPMILRQSKGIFNKLKPGI